MVRKTFVSSQKSKVVRSGAIRVIARAADVLNALAKHADGLSLGEIAKQVGLPRSTVQRIVQSLDNANLVIAASPTSGVRLGPALVALAASVKQLTIAEMARPLVVQLSKDTGESVDVATLGNDKAVIVDVIHGSYPLLAVSGLGSSRPLHASASGKALLAALSQEHFDELKKHLRLPAITRNTITDWARLEREIELARQTGLAFDHEEYIIGICAVAVAIRGPKDEIVSIALPTPTDRFQATSRQLSEALAERSKAFQRRI
jgi:IclR family transcriptional regulator, acetate operon repressor